MPEPQLIGPLARSTPSKASSSTPRPLPEDLLRDASRRLGIMCLLSASLWIVATILAHVAVRSMSHGDPQWYRLGATDAIALSSVIASLLLFFYTRTPGHDPRRILDLGLAYMILMAIDLGLTFHWNSMPMDGHLSPEISWVGAVVLMFAAIVPSTPGKTAVAAVVAVSMNPIAMLISRARGTWPFADATDALLMHYPDYLLAGVAVVISHVMTALGQQVAKARAMGSYQLGELLGRGGMGEVYRATHRMLKRPAAIKLIRPEMIAAGDPAGAQLAVARFTREAEAAANLRSPHTVELYDFGVTDDQTLYFVMELLEGLDLESLVRQYGPVPPARAIHILRQACASLAEAHARGLVHRDIKPANLHLGQLGLIHDFVKVLDFGLVKPISEAGDGASLATQAGLLIGTPGYIAPEMALSDQVDGRADIYALGCVAYYLLTGQQVFDGATAMQVLSKHLQMAPAPPSRTAPPGVPAALDEVILACLAKDPADRPQTAAELAARLAAIGLQPWSDEMARAWWATSRPRLSLAAEAPTRLLTISDTRTGDL
ncbi:MAG: serine/threonine-protein kinase [Vicinamibacterales bacterium]